MCAYNLAGRGKLVTHKSIVEYLSRPRTMRDKALELQEEYAKSVGGDAK